MSYIKAYPSLSGKLSSSKSLNGKISSKKSLNGKISSASLSENYIKYEGSFEVTSDVDSEQILQTANKYLSDNIVVKPIPYSEVDNSSNGLTVFIGKG